MAACCDVPGPGGVKRPAGPPEAPDDARCSPSPSRSPTGDMAQHPLYRDAEVGAARRRGGLGDARGQCLTSALRRSRADYALTSTAAAVSNRPASEGSALRQASTTWRAHSTYSLRRSSLQPCGGLIAMERRLEVLSASLMIWAPLEA